MSNMEDLQIKFTERLKELRAKKGISQRDIAKEIGISQNSYCLWEQGKTQPDLEKLIKLCQFFDVTVDYIVGYSDI